MQDLSGRVTPKMGVPEGFALLPDSVMQSLTGEDVSAEASKMIGLGTEEDGNGGS